MQTSRSKQTQQQKLDVDATGVMLGHSRLKAKRLTPIKNDDVG